MWKILFISEERRYERIVQQLRKSHYVDYIFKSSKLQLENGNYHIPKFLGKNIGYWFLATMITHYLLLRKAYDFCITDYRSSFVPSFFCVINNIRKSSRTKFIYDVRTIPVEYQYHHSRIVEDRFARQLQFANRFYHGLSLITDEMARHIEQKYIRMRKPHGIWESGADITLFKPRPKSINLKRNLGFEEQDFICFYHGSLSMRRGVIELVKSFKIINQKEKSIKLLILGNGDCYYRLSRIITEFRLNGAVKRRDYVPYDEVPEYISIADLCVIPFPDIDWWRVSSPLKLME